MSLKPTPRAFDFFPLEDRILLSADGLEPSDAPTGWELTDVDLGPLESLLAQSLELGRAEGEPVVEPPQEDPNGGDSRDELNFSSHLGNDASDFNSLGTVEPTTGETTLELVVIDSGVDEADTLLSHLRDQSSGATEWVVIRLDANRNGIEQISETLQTVSGVDAIHLLSHSDGQAIQLGDTRLDTQTAPQFASELARWQESLSPDADLLIYGCDLAASDAGRSLIDSIAAMTGCDVAASDDATGSDRLGGDWEFEYALGQVDTESAFRIDVQVGWNHLLDLTPNASETRVNVGTSGSQYTTPNGGGNLAINDSGQFAVTWFDYGTGDSDSYAAIYNVDGSIHVAPFRVHSASGAEQDWSNVAIADDGNVVVTWSDQRTGHYQVYMRLYDFDGNDLTGETLVSNLSGSQDFHAVDFAADGSYVIVFQNASNTDIYFQRYDSSGNALGGNVRANSSTSGTQDEPDIAVNDDGSFTIAWMSTTGDGSGNAVYARQFDASGTALGSDFRVNQNTAGDQWYATLDSDASGNFVVTWMSNGQDGSGEGIFARQYDASANPLGNEFQVNSYSAGDQEVPQVSMNDAGNFIITWQDTNGQDGSGDGIYAQQFDSSGVAIGDEILVNTTTANSQALPTVAYTGDDAIIVWSGEGTGDNHGVFYQRFKVSDYSPLAIAVDQTVPISTQVLDEDASLVFSTGTGNSIAVTDQQAGLNTLLQVTLRVDHGTLTLAQTNGLTFVAGTDGSSSLTVEGNESDLNAAFDGLVFTADANFNGNDTLTVLTALAADQQGFYTFDGGTPADQSLGNQYDGVPLGDATTTIDPQRGEVLSLDGNGDAIEIAGNYSNPIDVTLAAWVKTTDTQHRDVISLGDNIALRIGASNELIGFYNNGTTWPNLTSGAVLDSGWNHIALTFDDSNDSMKLFLNGIEVGSMVVTDSIQYTLSPNTVIGAHGNGGTGFDFQGLIDDVKIYSRALSADEVAALASESDQSSGSVALQIDPINDDPILAFNSGNVAYHEGGPVVALAPLASVSDVDGMDFNGGVLTTRITAQGESTDRLTVQDEGSGGGQVHVVGNDIQIDGVQIASFTGGIGAGDDLLITFTANADQNDVQKIVRQVSFSSVSGSPSTNQRTVQMQLSDGDGGISVMETRLVDVFSANNEQVLSVNTGATVAEGSSGNAITDAVLKTTDLDHSDAQLVYTLTNPTSHGTLFRGGVALVTTDTFTQADLAAGQITYNHDGSETSADTFDFSVDDGIGTATSGSFTLTITNINDAPTISAIESSTLHYSPSGGPIPLSSTVALDDADNTHLQSAVIEITGHYQNGEDVLSATDQFGITSHWDPANGRLTLTGTATLLEYQTVIRGVTYENMSGTPNPQTRTVSLSINDGQSSSSVQTRDVAVATTGSHSATALIDTDGASDSVPENAAPGTTVGITAYSDDADPADTITYSLDDDANGKFIIDATSGVVSVAGSLDFETAPSESIILRATSSDGSFATETFLVSIVDLNEAPVAVGESFALAPGESLTLSSDGVIFNDTDIDGDTLSLVLVSPPSGGTLSLQPGGNLVYTPFVNFFGRDSFSYRVSDGVLLSNVAAVTIDVPVVAPSGGGTGSTAGDTPSPSGSQTSPPPPSTFTPVDSSGESGLAGRAQSNPLSAPPPAPENATQSQNDSDHSETQEDASGNVAIAPPAGFGADAIKNGAKRPAGHDLGFDGSGRPRQIALHGDPSIRLIAFYGSSTELVSSQNLSSSELEQLERLLREDLQQAIVWGQWDDAREEREQTPMMVYVGVAGAGMSVFSVGYVFWALRGGALMSVFASALPAWRFIDPIAMLSAYRESKASAKDNVETLLG